MPAHPPGYVRARRCRLPARTRKVTRNRSRCAGRLEGDVAGMVVLD